MHLKKKSAVQYKVKCTSETIAIFINVILQVGNATPIRMQFFKSSITVLQVLCVGPTGSGKTLCISNKLLHGMPQEYMSHFITFSARTSANQTQDMIDSKLDKRYSLFTSILGNLSPLSLISHHVACNKSVVVCLFHST